MQEVIFDPFYCCSFAVESRNIAKKGFFEKKAKKGQKRPKKAKKGGPRGVRLGAQKRAKNGQKRPKKGVFWGNTFLTRFFRFSRVEHPREFSCVFGGKTPGKSPCQILCQNY